VERVVRLKGRIQKVFVGVMEPKKFVSDNTGQKRLEGAGIEVIHVQGLEEEILEVATAGHEKTDL
jgi:pyrimidine deaminase RibD-like protein